MFVFSPSNLSTYQQCPLKFWGQSISHELKWKATAQKSRGTLVHNAIEKALKEGLDAVKSWPDDIDMDFVRSKVSTVRSLISYGAGCYVEHEMCINEAGAPVDWWSENGAMRAKADVLVMHQSPDTPLFLVDIKTGKKWDTEDFQLRMEALIAHKYYQRPLVQYAYWYVDSGEVVAGALDFRKDGYENVQDIYDLMHDAKLDIMNASFRPTKNRFCKWCGFYKTEQCGL